MSTRRVKIYQRRVKMRLGVKGYKRRTNPNQRGLTFEQKIKKFVNTIRVKRRIKRESKEETPSRDLIRIQFDNLEWTCMDIGINIGLVSIGIYFSLRDPRAIQIDLHYLSKKRPKKFFDLGFFHSKKDDKGYFFTK